MSGSEKLRGFTSIFFLFCILFLFTIEVRAGQITFEVSSPPYSLSKSNGSHRIAIKGFHHIDQPGAPSVPMRVFWFSLPDSAVPESVSLQAEILAQETIADKISLPPVPPYLSKEGGAVYFGKNKKIVNNRDIHIYNKNSWFPELVVAKGQLSSSRGRNVRTQV